MTKFFKFISIVLTLLTITDKIYAQNFIVNQPINYFLCYPVRSWQSISLPVSVTSQTQGTYLVSFDRNGSFRPYDSWVSIYNDGQNISNGQTITFTLIITPIANDGIYDLPMYFNAVSGNNNYPFTGPIFKVLVDNSNPTVPTVSVTRKTSTSISISWNSTDVRSKQYTDINPTTGINGIKEYKVEIKNSNQVIVESKTINAISGNYYTFNNLLPNSNYSITVTAKDLAGNISNSSDLLITTCLAAPTNLTYTSTNYCSTTLNWSASAGATSYKIYNYSVNPVVTYNTSSTTYTVTGLTTGKSYNFYVTALRNNDESDHSNTLSVATLVLPTPVIIGPDVVCPSGGTFTATNLPSGCNISWQCSSNLNLSSTSGSSATFISNGNGTGYVSAIYNSGCGNTNTNYGTVVGSPKPGPISIDFDAPPRRFTASFDGVNSATSYKWYLDGELKYNALKTSVIFPRQINNCDHVYYIDVVSVNACGESELRHAETSEPPCSDNLTVFPNPANEYITLNINNPQINESIYSSDSKINSNLICTNQYSIRILDNFGILKANLIKSGTTVVIPVSNYHEGIYVLEINDGKNIYKKEFVIQH